jgi:NitT/TauT family transport system ATP-binding protein
VTTPIRPPIAEASRLRLVTPQAPVEKEAEPPLIVFDDVAFDRNGRRVLNAVSFGMRRAQICCVVGPRGAGKSTLVNLLAGLIAPTTGEIRRDGHRVSGPASDAGLVFQDHTHTLLPWRTVHGNVRLALEAARVPRHERKDRIDAALARTGLTSEAGRYPHQLSHGSRQRLQLARALVTRPGLLLLDEPLYAVDLIGRHALQDELLHLVRDSGTTVLMVTEDVDEAIYLADSLLVLRATPGEQSSLADTVEIDLPHPRQQRATREDPLFLRARREVLDVLARG